MRNPHVSGIRDESVSHLVPKAPRRLRGTRRGCLHDGLPSIHFVGVPAVEYFAGFERFQPGFFEVAVAAGNW